MPNIKVLHVIARMNVGGTARYVEELVSKIPESCLATGNVQGAEIEDLAVQNLKVCRVNHMGRKISPLDDVKAWLELRKIVNLVQPQIIHTHTFKAGLIGRLIRGPYKRVHTYHGHLFGDESFSETKKRVIRIVERLLASRTDLLISVGIQVGEELRESGVGPTRNWLSIAPGVSQLSNVDRRQSRISLGLDLDQILVGWMARVTAVKNPHLLLEVARELPEVHFVLAGGGDLLEEIRNLAPKNVTVLGWTDALTFWSAVDIAISTSNNEGMPVALIEAQIAGIPVVATDVGSNSEVIADGVTGYVTPKTRTALVYAVRVLVENSSLRIKMGKQAKKRAVEHFSIPTMLEAHMKAYNSLN